MTPPMTKTTRTIHLCEVAWSLYDAMCAVPDDQLREDEHRALTEHRRTCQECKEEG